VSENAGTSRAAPAPAREPDFDEESGYAEGDAAQDQAPIRILVVEDHVSLREALVFMLSREPDLTVVGKAGLVADARVLLRRVVADVALVDLDFPDGSGVDVIGDVRRVNPKGQVLVFTAREMEHLWKRSGTIARRRAWRNTLGNPSRPPGAAGGCSSLCPSSWRALPTGSDRVNR
jgi:CheY-like chemotaxis protein